MDKQEFDKKKVRKEVVEAADRIIKKYKNLFKKLAREDKEW